MILLSKHYRVFDFGQLKGKRIAIIGPADSVFKEKRGKYIDQFDFVVRINKSPIVIQENLFPEYLGQKTDILFHSFYENPKSGGGPLDFDLFLSLGIRYVINPMTGYWGLKFSHNFYKKYLRGESVFRVPFRLYKGLLKTFSPHRPTTGFYALKFVLESDFSELYISGFTFFKTPYVSGYRDHVREVDANKVFMKQENQHNPDLEFRQFLLLLEKHRFKRIILDSTLKEIIESDSNLDFRKN